MLSKAAATVALSARPCTGLDRWGQLFDEQFNK